MRECRMRNRAFQAAALVYLLGAGVVGAAEEAAVRSVVAEPNPMAQRVIGRIEQAVDNGQIDGAMEELDQLRALRGGGLVSFDSVHLVPLPRAIEQLLLEEAHAPLLAAYRRVTDPVVDGLMQRRPDDETLARIEREFFACSHGDDAAFARACHWMDQYQFGRAAALFGRVATVHPDPSMDRSALFARWIVATCRAGRVAEAKKLLQQLDAGRDGEGALIAIARRELAKAEQQVAAARAQRAPAQSRWRTEQVWRGEVIAGPRRSLSPLVELRHNAKPKTREQLLKSWRGLDLVPRHALAIDDDLAYFRDHRATRCVALPSGKEQWAADDDIEPVRSMTGYGGVPLYRRVGDPKGFEERFIVGDPLAHEAAVVGDMVVVIEGQGALGVLDCVNIHRFNRKKKLYATAMAFRDARSGKLLARLGRCQLPASEPDGMTPDAPFRGVQFLCMPAADAQRLYVATSAGHTVWLHAIDRAAIRRADGGAPPVGWSVALCVEASLPPGTGQPVGLAATDDQVYVSTGESVIVALDAADGSPRWATRYEATRIDVPKGITAPHQERYRPVGWSLNRIILTNSYLVAAPTDARRLVILDRWTGRTIATPAPLGMGGHPMRGQLLLGVDEDAAWVSSNSELVGVRLDDGQVFWRAKWGGKPGRPRVRDGLVLAPIGSGKQVTLAAFDLHAEGRRVAEHKIQLPSEDAIMSLHPTGDALYAWGIDSLYRLEPQAKE